MTSYLKTGLLLSALTALLVTIGYLVGGSNGLILMFGFSLVINFVSYFFSDKIALAVSRAQQITENDYPEIFRMTKSLTDRMQIPMPRLYISNAIQPNAFATGRNLNNSAVCFTTGLLTNLNNEEIEGVLAHELAHIKNRDVLISTIAAVIAGTISSITDFLMFSAIFGDDEDNQNPFVSLLLIIVAPIIALILQLAISRSREYIADETAARFTKDPKGLANALIKIESIAMNYPLQVNSAMASLYIQNPFKFKGVSELFSTHPPTEKRVERLLNIRF